MRLQFFDLCPFICDLKELESHYFDNIRKRSIITPFNLTYYYAKYISYLNGHKKLTTFDKSEIKNDPAVIKVSYNDFSVLQELSSKFVDSYSKFNEFYLNYKQEQQKQTIIEENTETNNYY